jgi:hypothetical protein
MKIKIDPKAPIGRIMKDHGIIATVGDVNYAILDFVICKEDGSYYITDQVPESVVKLVTNPMIKRLIS